MFFTLILLFSCKNGDIVIQKSKLNCDCVSDIEKIYDAAALEYGRNSGGFNYGNFNCLNPFKYNSSQYKILSKANTIELINKSETKVYEVIIQYLDSGSISYLTYKLEPTQILSLGCDTSITPVYNGGYYAQPDIQSIGLFNIRKIEYKIHKVRVISEY